MDALYGESLVVVGDRLIWMYCQRHRAVTKVCHASRSFASSLTPDQVCPALRISFFKALLHVSVGLPCLRWLWGFQSRLCRVMLISKTIPQPSPFPMFNDLIYQDLISSRPELGIRDCFRPPYSQYIPKTSIDECLWLLGHLLAKFPSLASI
ncbi:unnamed protein product [Nezara viridula]|uniref:Uncharacterized protein n=1 Tax=Nezara viridula TaxID=85310 RepID=A0A9P0E8P3_NEZVI|nr:unnamed protein product [Nezara viridula]